MAPFAPEEQELGVLDIETHQSFTIALVAARPLEMSFGQRLVVGRLRGELKENELLVRTENTERRRDLQIAVEFANVLRISLAHLFRRDHRPDLACGDIQDFDVGILPGLEVNAVDGDQVARLRAK